MTTRADNDPRFSRRFLFLGLAAIAFALWFLYDGSVTYPKERERGLAYKQLMVENEGDPQAFRDRWHELAKENNWSTNAEGLLDPHTNEPKSEGEIIMQFVMAGIVTVVALFLLSIPWRARGKWIEGSATGITSSWGQSFNYDQVLELNKRQWRSKGIAKVVYQDGNRKRRFVIDDYKFDRYPTDAILYELEQHIDAALITNGSPEPPPEEASQVAELDESNLPASENG